MKSHHRNYAYRPPYRPRDRTVGPSSLLWRFMRDYLAPFRGRIALCALLAALDYAGAFYLLAYYTKVVVDDVLVVRSTGAEPAPPAAGRARDTGRSEPPGSRLSDDRRSPADSRPQAGIDRRLDRGVAISARPPDAGRRLAVVFVLYMATLLASNLSSRYSARQRIRISQAMTARLREDMHAKVLDLSLSAQSVHTPGRLMARILSDVSMVSEQLLTLIINVSSQVTIVLFGFGMLFAIHWRMALIVLACLPFYVLIYKMARPHLRQAHRELSHTNACLYGLVSQKLDAVKMVQACNREAKEYLVFHRLAACYLRDTLLQNRISGASNHTAELLSGVASTGVLFLYGIGQVLRGTISLGQMMYAWNAAAALFSPVLSLSQLNVTVTQLLVSLNRLAEILDEPVRIRDAPDAVDLSAPLRRGISLSHVWFSYAAEGPPVFRDLSLEVPAGRWIGIMGASGAGKTTLLHLLARLIEPDEGAILYDGLPLDRIRLASLRKHLALVPQEAQILSGTVRDNICYGRPDAEPREIIAAAQSAEFHDFIMQMKVQYETLIGEKGTSLSGGQKQRLSLARALLTQPDILLLDDCTSALDAETEHRIQNTLTRILAGKTAVIVTQRVSMAQRCHRVYVLDQGVISEAGTHDELVGRNGFYARLAAKQLGA